MTGNETKKQAKGESDDKTNGLYHKKDLSHRRQPPDFRPTGGPRKGPARDLSYTALITNLRVFAVVAGCMLVMLLVAVWVARMGMQIRNRRTTHPPSETAAAKIISSAGTTNETVDEQQPAIPDETMLDTSAIRKALFLTKQGSQLSESGDMEGAIDLYREALAVWPNLSQAWISLGQAYLTMGRYDQAQLALEKAVEQDPSNVAILNDLGTTHLHQGDLDHAEEYFLASVEISADYAAAYYNLAQCQLNRRSNDQARAYLDLFLRKQPDDARALKELAYLDALTGHYESALKNLNRAISSSPGWAALYFDAAAASALLGRVEDTFRYLNQALDRTSPRAAYQIYQQPAFQDMRNTEAGRDFEKTLAERTRKLLASPMSSGSVDNAGERPTPTAPHSEIPAPEQATQHP